MAMKRSLHARDVHPLFARPAAVELRGQLAGGSVPYDGEGDLNRFLRHDRGRAAGLCTRFNVASPAMEPDPALHGGLANIEPSRDLWVAFFTRLVGSNDTNPKLDWVGFRHALNQIRNRSSIQGPGSTEVSTGVRLREHHGARPRRTPRR